MDYLSLTHETKKQNKILKLHYKYYNYYKQRRWFDPSWCHWNFSLT